MAYHFIKSLKGTDQPLYTYQIDCVGSHLIEKLNSPTASAVTLEHSLGNVALLDNWVSQVKNQTRIIDEDHVYCAKIRSCL